MKSKSIRIRITLWFTAALALIVALTFAVILSVSNSVIQKTVQDNLIETVENNVDEIEFFSLTAPANDDNDDDYYIAYNGGYLEIDDDFLDQVNGISTTLCRSDGALLYLLYGSNSTVKETLSLPFTDGQVQTIPIDGVTYYIFDRMLTQNGLDGLWLRGIVSEEQGDTQLSAIVRLSLILLPLLVLFAVVGGYLIAGRTLKPIHEIADAASQISQGRDLKKRIDLGKGTDELHQLADTFNGMFERLDQAFEAERQFTSDASHELRTPMSVILAQCEYSLEEPQNTEEYQNALRVIQRQGGKMSKLINDMLDFIRLEKKADHYPRAPLDLSQLVSSLCEDMALIRENGIILTYHVAESIFVNGNPELLTRLLINLIGNAYRYGTPDGHITVHLTRSGDTIQLSVADDGIGISKDQQEKIFQRFYQVDPSRSNGGTGLGLAIVQEIARFHGGTVKVLSAPGEGSTFILTLPNECK